MKTSYSFSSSASAFEYDNENQNDDDFQRSSPCRLRGAIDHENGIPLHWRGVGVGCCERKDPPLKADTFFPLPREELLRRSHLSGRSFEGIDCLCWIARFIAEC